MKKIASFLLAVLTVFSVTACNSPKTTTPTATSATSALLSSLTDEQLLDFAVQNTYKLNDYEADVDISLKIPPQDSFSFSTYTTSAHISAKDMKKESKRFSITKNWRKNLLDEENIVSDIYYENGFFYVTENGENAKIPESDETAPYTPSFDMHGIIKSIPAEIYEKATVTKDGDVTLYSFELSAKEFKSIHAKLCEQISATAQALANKCGYQNDTGAELNANGSAKLEYRVQNGFILSHKISFEGRFSNLVSADNLCKTAFESTIVYTDIESSSVETPEGFAEYKDYVYGMMPHEVAANAISNYLYTSALTSFSAQMDTEIKMQTSGLTVTIPYNIQYKTETGLQIAPGGFKFGAKKESHDISVEALGTKTEFSVYLLDNTYYLVSGDETAKMSEGLTVNRPQSFCRFSRLENIILSQSNDILKSAKYEYIDKETARITFEAKTEKEQAAFEMSNRAYLEEAYLALTGTSTNIPEGAVSGGKIEFTVKNGMITEYTISADINVKTTVDGVETIVPSSVKTTVKISKIGSTYVILPEGYKNFPEA